MISLRGKEWLITEVRTGGAGDSRWFGGGLRFTATEQELLTNVARTIFQHSRKATGQLPLPHLQSSTINSTLPETKVTTGDGDGLRRGPGTPVAGPGEDPDQVPVRATIKENRTCGINTNQRDSSK